MTDETLSHLLTVLSGMPSSAPWSENVGAVFTLAVRNVADDLALRTIERVAMTEEWRPTPARFLAITGELLLGDLPEVPLATDVVDEIRYHVCFHGQRARRDAEISHPLINRVVDQLGGWVAICRMREGELDKAMPVAYTTCTTEWRTQKIGELISLSPEDRAIEVESWKPLVTGRKNHRSVIVEEERPQIAGSVSTFISNRFEKLSKGDIK